MKTISYWHNDTRNLAAIGASLSIGCFFFYKLIQGVYKILPQDVTGASFFILGTT